MLAQPLSPPGSFSRTLRSGDYYIDSVGALTCSFIANCGPGLPNLGLAPFSNFGRLDGGLAL
jgi:hypothetical protein